MAQGAPSSTVSRRNAAGNCAAGASDSHRLQLNVPLEGPHEVDPALEVVRFMYSGQLQPGLVPLQLLMVRKLAQYLLCPACIAACDTALALAKRPTFPEALAVLSSPHAEQFLLEAEASKFVAACADVAASQLCGTLQIARSPELGQQFAGLTLHALHLLLAPSSGGSRRSRLPVDCEETVLLLLHRWAVANNPPAAWRYRLRTLLRPLQLCLPYLRRVLPLVWWLDLSPEEHVQLVAAAEAALVPELRGRMEEWLAAEVFNAQHEWIAPSSERAYSSGLSKDAIIASWTREQLKSFLREALLAGGRLLAGGCCTLAAPTKTLFAGYEWHLEVEVRLQSEEMSAAGGLYLRGSVVADCAELGAEPALALARAFLRADHDKPKGMPQAQHMLEAVCARCGEGSATFFMANGALDMAAWAPFLRDGRLRVDATLFNR